MSQSKYQIKLLSSLEKVFPEEEPIYRPECLKLSGFWKETVSFQVAYYGEAWGREYVRLCVTSPIKEAIRVRSVELVPVSRAVNPEVDDNYLRTAPGLYPDLLRELQDNQVLVPTKQWRSLWVDVVLDDNIKAGRYPIEIAFVKEGEILAQTTMEVEVLGAYLPEQKIMHTEWFHGDCLADYYHVPVFSEEHWQLIENYLNEYVSRGCNMILTPLFTLPLDTAINGERTTMQLIQVEKTSQGYTFDFSLLKRWIDLCQSVGIKYFEMSHLFSQWGAKYPPKIMAKVGGNVEKIFGWHTKAVGEYTRFLQEFLPELTSHLRQWGIAEKTYFHISDEPQEEDLETYRAAKESLGDLLKGFKTFDALSSYEFYRHNLVEKPIPGNNEIHEFLEHGLTQMWTYYCTGQYLKVSNRFMSMPSARNRIYGVQLFKYDIIGILHWGYNFYNSQYSLEKINPYQVTDAMSAFPAGDPFLVYPGVDGFPEESIRMMVHYEALTDLRALRFLESLTSKEYVMSLVEEDLLEPLTFINYPVSSYYLLHLRQRVNQEIKRELIKRGEWVG